MTKEKNIFCNMSIPENYRLKENEDKTLFTMESRVQTLVAKDLKEIDTLLSKTMYEEYKKLGITDLYIMNLEEFKKFVLKYMPMYLKEREND